MAVHYPQGLYPYVCHFGVCSTFHIPFGDNALRSRRLVVDRLGLERGYDINETHESLSERVKTHRIENLPTGFDGITVAEDSSEEAPSIPCSESDGNRMRAINRSALLLDTATEPISSVRSCCMLYVNV